MKGPFWDPKSVPLITTTSSCAPTAWPVHGEVLHLQLQLQMEDLLDVVFSREGRDVPFLGITDPSDGILRSGDSGDIAETGAPEVADEAVLRVREPVARSFFDEAHLLLCTGNRSAPPIRGGPAGLVDRLLPDDGVEIVPALGHPARRRRG